VFAATLLCFVISITDGDTLKARCGNQTLTIRLAEIDAPEKRQAFGNRAKSRLAGLCYQEQAEIQTTTKDRYGRTIARVCCYGIDVWMTMVWKGMAWSYTKYLTDANVSRSETLARREHSGLWVDANPTAPWVWRHTPKAVSGR
jgi:micrococcal nuclease